MRYLHLIIAGLHPEPGPSRAELFEGMPALKILLTRGQRFSGDFTLSPAQRLARFTPPDSPHAIALAPLRLAHEGLDASSPGWLCADPVHLRLMRDHILLGDAHTFELDVTEARALVDGLNEHFRERVEFVAVAPDRWYARLATPLGGISDPLDAHLARPVEASAGSSSAARDLARLGNEVQMYLHQHPVNAAREARGADPVNSVWFWGGGEALRPVVPAVAMLGESFLAEAVAAAGGVPYLPLNACAAILADEHDSALLYIDSLHAPASYGQYPVLRQRLLELETSVFQPLLAGLRRGRIEAVIIEVLGATGYGLRLDRWDTWKFWRR